MRLTEEQRNHQQLTGNCVFQCRCQSQKQLNTWKLTIVLQDNLNLLLTEEEMYSLMETFKQCKIIPGQFQGLDHMEL